MQTRTVEKVFVAALACLAACLTAGTFRNTDSGKVDHTIAAPLASAFAGDDGLPIVLWVGDSYTAGTGAQRPGATGYADLVSASMGWVCYVDADGGTGFVDNVNPPDERSEHLTILQRFDAESRLYRRLDYIVVDGGRNDYLASSSQEEAAVNRYLSETQRRFPNAKFIFILPWKMGEKTFKSFAGPALQAAARKYHAVVIDPVAEGWSAPPRASAWLMKDGTHFFQPGHDFVAGRILQDLRKAFPN